MTTTPSDTVWRIAADTGGTFTDCIAVAPDGSIHRAKTLSSARLRATLVEQPDARTLRISAPWRAEGLDPAGAVLTRIADRSVTARIDAVNDDMLSLTTDVRAEPGDLLEFDPRMPAPVLAAHLATRTPLAAPLPSTRFRLATTRATNALLERKVAPVALFVTEGFADLLVIGDQRRPELFARQIIRSRPLTDHVFEVPGRIRASGDEIRPLNEPAVRDAAQRARRSGAQTAAVALVNAWARPEHEQRVAAILREVGFNEVVLSSDVSPLIRYLPRLQTTLVDACLRPILGAYLDDVRTRIGHSPLYVMTSAGGLERAETFHPSDGLLSGPAGGVVGALEAGRRSGFDCVISFDMGGTSTDVARLDGAVEYTFEHTVGDAKILRPAAAIETVAAGGGSICSFDHGLARVGPESAGANPGPACYRAGGPLTVTDCNVLLGRVDMSHFETPLDVGAASHALDAVLDVAPARAQSRDMVVQGFIDLADQHMADAIGRVSRRKGYDPAEYALVAFGGAGPQHACAVAEHLGVTTIVIPEDASLLSAVGLAGAPVTRTSERQVLRPLADFASDATSALEGIRTEAIESVRADLADASAPVASRTIVRMRYAGQEQSLDIEIDEIATARNRFEQRYAAVFGALHDERAIEVESLRVIASDSRVAARPPAGSSNESIAQSTHTQRVFAAGGWRDIPVYDRDFLAPGAAIEGPALITERRTTTYVAPHWRASLDSARAIVLRADESSRLPAQTTSTAVQRELLIARLTGIAEQMGDALARTAVSTNVKDRLDFSCAVIDADGFLVTSAPHMPVHLGALGECTRAVLGAIEFRPGDVVLTNHPAFGGSHLPDLTLVQPVHDQSGELLAYVASRAHHAEIGGISPGSMPANATSLADEGVAIAPMRLVDQGVPQWDHMRAVLTDAPRPSRSVEENLADLRAALAAGRWAADAITALATSAGADRLRDAMQWIQSHTETIVRERIASLGAEPRSAIETLDDGAEIRVQVAAGGDALNIDFTGTSPTHARNLNAPLSVVRSATSYVMRLLIDRDVPLNDGLLRAVRIAVPEGCMLNPVFTDDPARCPAVAGGNVETSQRIVDALLRALGVMAAGQGTMNNTIIGNDRFSYYETVCGGSAAGPSFDGCPAVHTHMTNTAITDVELVEHRYPMRIERFTIRTDSGGAGAHSGGDGAVREYVFDEPVEISVVGQRRTHGAPGEAGGADGKPGSAQIITPDGAARSLDSIDQTTANASDALRLKTPGAGGWGAIG
jgi:5-oxoprolinase (ATP-hydrolysing)